MTDTIALAQLDDVQRKIRAVVEGLDEHTIKAQYHPELSPLGWHLGHTSFIEHFWLCEQALGEPGSAELAALYFPESSPKPHRGGRLPAREALLRWSETQHRETLRLLAAPPARLAAHPLMKDGYLSCFLLQHHAQHLEIMRMVLSQRAIAGGGTLVTQILQPRPPRPRLARLPAGEYAIGSDEVGGYDNEQPVCRVRLREMSIARDPVSNSEYLAFIEAGGYAEPRWWCAEGWRWRQAHAATAPEHWRPGGGGWGEIGPEGAQPLAGEDALLGINWFEAAAFARWAGGRLPHEYEWEAAAGLGLLARLGSSWEWCDNHFHPYPGFRPFPYDGYSLPWFDGAHYVLRGGSRHTHECVRRPSFRNFYGADKRHIFAGLRLAFD